MRIRTASLVFLLILLLGWTGAPASADCEWKYKCDWVLQREPFICGRWAPDAEKICSPSTAQSRAVAEDITEEDVGSFQPFQVIKAPCIAPYVSNRRGKCRLVFGA